MNDVIFGLKSFIREGKQGNGASHVSIHVHNCSNKCTTDGLEHGHQKVNSTFNHLQFEDFSSRPPSPTGGKVGNRSNQFHASSLNLIRWT